MRIAYVVGAGQYFTTMAPVISWARQREPDAPHALTDTAIEFARRVSQALCQTGFGPS